MAQRITDLMVTQKQCELGQILAEVAGVTGLTLYNGNKAVGVTNKLVINKTNVWADGMGGHSKRDAYNALRMMIAALAVVADEKRKS